MDASGGSKGFGVEFSLVGEDLFLSFDSLSASAFGAGSALTDDGFELFSDPSLRSPELKDCSNGLGSRSCFELDLVLFGDLLPSPGRTGCRVAAAI